MTARRVAAARRKIGKLLRDKHAHQRRRGAVLDVLAHAQCVTGELLVSLKSPREFPPLAKLSTLHK